MSNDVINVNLGAEKQETNPTNPNGTWIDLAISRGPVNKSDELSKIVGISLHIKASPVIEDYMARLSNKQKVNVDDYGGSWYNLSNKDRLQVYFSEEIPPNKTYTFSAIGTPLLVAQRNSRIVEDAEPNYTANLTILRLVGISKPDGLRVGITGPYSGEYVQNLRNKFPSAIRQFLHDYLVPISVNLKIIER